VRWSWKRRASALRPGAWIAILLVLVSAEGVAAAERRNRPSDETGGVTLAFIGDFGTANAAQRAVAELVTEWQPDAIITAGDNYYASSVGGTGTDRYDRAVGAYYCRFLQGVAPGEHCEGGGAETNAFWPATGNHDYTEGGIANYLAYFRLPGNERYYDVVIGHVHVFIIDSHRALRRDPEMAGQRGWLKQALAASTAAWKVVVAHHPPYSSGTHGPSVGMRWPFNEWGADLVVVGHEHDYERLAAEGIPYVVNGLGGATRRGFRAIDPGSVARFWTDWGALRIRATGSRLEGSFVSVDGRIEQDTFALDRPAKRPLSFGKDGPGDGALTASTSRVRLRWQESLGAHSYEYCVDARLDGRCTSGWRNAGARTRITVKGLRAGAVYEWQVRALNSSGQRIADKGVWRGFTTGA
jgi:tartrate-resistant acid phosphatase type 5